MSDRWNSWIIFVICCFGEKEAASGWIDGRAGSFTPFENRLDAGNCQSDFSMPLLADIVCTILQGRCFAGRGSSAFAAFF